MSRFFPLCGFLSVLLLSGIGSTRANGAEIEYPPRAKDGILLEKLRKGEVAVNAKNEEALEQLAKWLAWRIAHPPFNGKEPEKKAFGIPEDIETLMEDANRWCTRPNLQQPPDENQLLYAKSFSKILAKELMYVYNNSDKKLDKVNAARMLAIVGKLPNEELADTYLAIIRDNAYPDEIRLFAFQGLRNLLAIPHHINPTNHFFKSTPKLAEISLELEKYITHKCSPGLSADGARLVQYIRREAVRALAQMKFAVIRQQQTALAKPIMTLLRVATNDKYVAPNNVALPGYGYHILERIEAVIGICSMLPDRNINWDLVTYLVNDAMIDIAAFQAKERTDFQKDPRNKPLVPWRITGVRLADAFNAWKKNLIPPVAPIARNPKFATDFVDQAVKIVAKLEGATEGVTAQPDYRFFNDWKSDKARKPKERLVIAEDDTTAIDVK